jgi:hypothetical protein
MAEGHMHALAHKDGIIGALSRRFIAFFFSKRNSNYSHFVFSDER